MDNYLDNYQKGGMLYPWSVKFSGEAVKSIKTLPGKITERFYALVRDMRVNGPYRNNWKNYGKFKGCQNIYHCHLNSGRPRYVVCWEVMDKNQRVIEVYYVGTHQKAPY